MFVVFTTMTMTKSPLLQLLFLLTSSSPFVWTSNNRKSWQLCNNNFHHRVSLAFHHTKPQLQHQHQHQTRRRSRRRRQRQPELSQPQFNASSKLHALVPLLMIPPYSPRHRYRPTDSALENGLADGDDDSHYLQTTATMTSTLRSIILQKINRISISRQARGRLDLLLVSLLYGTLNTTLRAIYTMENGAAPVPSVLSFVRQILSVATFLPMIFLATRRTTTNTNTTTTTTTTRGELSLSPSKHENVDNTSLNVTFPPMWRSALELAFWNFGAQVRKNSVVIF